MIRNLVYFTAFYITSLTAVTALADSIVYIGTLSAALMATPALFYRLRKMRVKPTKTKFIVLVLACSGISTILFIGFEQLLYGGLEKHAAAIITIIFILNFLFIFILLRSIYISMMTTI